MRIGLVLLVLLGAGVATMFLRFKKRTEQGVRRKAAAREEQAVRLAEGRRTAETEYVLSRIETDLNRARAGDVEAPSRAARLEEIREVLTLTLRPQNAPFPVSGPCAEVIESLREHVGDRDLVYSETGDGRWLHVLGDRALLRWALRELLTNALEHAGDWTRISILAEPVDDGILLTVRDDGRGLDPSLAARLYSPFTPRAASSGPGLGLYVVRGVVESTGGTIEARSAPGQGVLHRLRLPHPASGPYGDAPGAASRLQTSRGESAS